ncbi:hypothetical protein FRC02_008396 [Tulasnella sp. 418]|nr:hypothetical protein FRC02_008396 [Tulasnella sp. 418]
MNDEDETVIPPPLRPPFHNTSSPRDKEPIDADIETLLKWQQERLERKLRGEYESSVRHLVDVINSSTNSPARIASVRVEGARQTRKSFLANLINPLIPSDTSDTTFGDVLHTVRHMSSILKDAQVFTSVEPTLQRSTVLTASPDDLDIVLKCKERGKWFLKTATDLGNQEGSATATARVLNAFGGAETIEGNLSFGTKTKQAFQLRLEAPLVWLDNTLRTRGEISAFGLERDNSTFASSREGARGLKFSIRAPSSLGNHEVAYELSSRHISGLLPDASISIREAAGQSIKSALAHTLLRDTRNDTMFATKGSYWKVLNELAGVGGGDALHFKNETISQISRQIANGLAVSLSASAGLMYSLSQDPRAKTLLNDRFHLGGPLSVRMFKQNGLGPRDGNDSLGGDIYWSAGASVISDLPKKPHWPIKLHAFVNAGRLDRLDKSISLVDAVKATISRPSVSAGVGLIYRFDPVRVELNFGVPLVASKTDAVRKGFQVGMGLEFL